MGCLRPSRCNRRAHGWKRSSHCRKVSPATMAPSPETLPRGGRSVGIESGRQRAGQRVFRPRHQQGAGVIQAAEILPQVGRYPASVAHLGRVAVAGIGDIDPAGVGM
ncbi:hypothetical protein G6F31_020450 [Rhizopus arrhizus]|nr:hypothetical protein G6F31_020450 [Rhizopus arrhizus]